MTGLYGKTYFWLLNAFIITLASYSSFLDARGSIQHSLREITYETLPPSVLFNFIIIPKRSFWYINLTLLVHKKYISK